MVAHSSFFCLSGAVFASTLPDVKDVWRLNPSGRQGSAKERLGVFVQPWNCPTQANNGLEWATRRELFERRNRIVHWGYVNSTKAEAQLCHTLAVAIISILREMDRSAYRAL
jgi:hypothetical protein